MKKKIVWIIVSLTLIGSGVLSFFLFKPSSKNVPEYTGMTLSSSISTLANSSFSNEICSVSQNKGAPSHNNTPGGSSGDIYHGHANPNINQNEPFGSGMPNVNSAADKLEVTPADPIYYANVNEEAIITVKINNPAEYEILSFTLNGKKYSSFMFERGSDLENIKIRVNVGDLAGIKEFTIDAIKYVKGEKIKDAKMSGEKTIKVGVRNGDMVMASLSGSEITTSSISFTANFSDDYDLLALSNGSAKAVLYDGEKIIDSKPIQKGYQRITFSGLEANTLYEYAIIADCDRFDGLGKVQHVLSKNATYTQRFVNFSEVSVSESAINFTYNWNSLIDEADREITKAELFLDGEKVKDLSTTQTQLENLYSERNYMIVAAAKDALNKTHQIYLHFTTKAKPQPVATTTIIPSSKDSITTNTIIRSLEDIITFEYKLLYANGQTGEYDLHSSFSKTKEELLPFLTKDINNCYNLDLPHTDLYPNTSYFVEINCLYNANTGLEQSNSKNQLARSEQKRTQTAMVPYINTSYCTATYGQTVNSASLSLIFSDEDNVCENRYVRITNNKNDLAFTKNITSNTLNLNSLEADTTYKLELVSEYYSNGYLNEHTTGTLLYIPPQDYSIEIKQIKTKEADNYALAGELTSIQVEINSNYNYDLVGVYINGKLTKNITRISSLNNGPVIDNSSKLYQISFYNTGTEGDFDVAITGLIYNKVDPNNDYQVIYLSPPSPTLTYSILPMAEITSFRNLNKTANEVSVEDSKIAIVIENIHLFEFEEVTLHISQSAGIATILKIEKLDASHFEINGNNLIIKDIISENNNFTPFAPIRITLVNIVSKYIHADFSYYSYTLTYNLESTTSYYLEPMYIEYATSD